MVLLHGSCAACDDDAVLLLGPPGVGKSDLVLRLLDRPGWCLVADDQVEVSVTEEGTLLRAAAPPALSGMLEVRGLGLLASLPARSATLRLAVDLVADRGMVPRLPNVARFECAGVTLPRLALHAFDASAPAKVGRALDAATSRARLRAGAFA